MVEPEAFASRLTPHALRLDSDPRVDKATADALEAEEA